MGTLLTDPLPPEAQAKIEAELQRKAEAAERARFVVLQIWLEGYKEGRLKFEDMCRRAALAVCNLTDRHRQQLLGELVDAALAASPTVLPQRRKGEPWVLQQAVIEVIDEVLKRDGLPMAASRNNMGAFERAVEVLTAAGIGGLTPRQIKSWYFGEK